ncbi:IclR family transcriptional regulator [Gordonia humi]|uniref:IclR family acetate operon transcriptional repressor n=1 Tax=Gordonia humi TaxID=686429 RepID=A0A840F5N0_9ACTN|nr:IclR family transcriptional regulator [Gordonia humi]MBB4137964.1 IclR family acetate operon transcriptional repressor [Gordonia humi]
MQQTVVTALRVLDEVAKHQPAGVSDLAARMDMSKSTMQRTLRALEAAGWIRPAGGRNDGWVLTAKPIDLSRYVAADTGLRRHTRSAMAALRDETGESVHLAVREGTEVVVVEVEESSSPVRIYWPAGTRSACHASANGKAILSRLPPDEVDDLLTDDLPGFTPLTITARAALLDELSLVRERGFAVAEGELRDDIASVASPILGKAGAPLGSISVFLPRHRLADGDVDRLGRATRIAATTITESLRA